MLGQESGTSSKVLPPPDEASRIQPKSQGRLRHTCDEKGNIACSRNRELTTKGALGGGTLTQLLAHRLGCRCLRLQRPLSHDKVLR